MVYFVHKQSSDLLFYKTADLPAQTLVFLIKQQVEYGMHKRFF